MEVFINILYYNFRDSKRKASIFKGSQASKPCFRPSHVKLGKAPGAKAAKVEEPKGKAAAGPVKKPAARKPKAAPKAEAAAEAPKPEAPAKKPRKPKA